MEGSVAKLEQGLASVEAPFKSIPNLSIMKNIKINKGEKKTVLDISGKGVLYAFRLIIPRNWVSQVVTIELDGNVVNFDVSVDLNLFSTSHAYKTGSSSSYTYRVLNDDGTPSERGGELIEMSSSAPYETKVKLFSQKECTYYFGSRHVNGSMIIGQKEPFEFNTRLKITIDTTPNASISSDFSSTYCSIAYSLDPT